MKKILVLIIISISVNSNVIAGKLEGIGPQDQVSQIIVNRALESDVAFNTNGFEYQLILGGKAVYRNSNNIVSGLSNSNIWAGQKGSYQLSISNDGVGAMSSALNSNNTNFKLIAYNPSSMGIAIINGDIIVKLRPSYNAEEIAGTFNVDLVENFVQINTAMYRVKRGQDMFAVTQMISNHPGVEFAEIDVTEHLETGM